MKKEIIEFEELGSVEVTTSPRAKNIRLKIDNGTVKVTKPRLVPMTAVKKFVEQNTVWASKKLTVSKKSRLLHDFDVVAPGVSIRFIPTHETDVPKSELIDKVLLIRHPKTMSWEETEVQVTAIAALTPILRTSAKDYLPGRLKYLAELYGFSYKQLRLKNIHSRWGSCSSAGNINLNIQLMRLDEDLIDHVLLHELSHTKALNHGADFWEIFENVRPGARAERKQLKQRVIF